MNNIQIFPSVVAYFRWRRWKITQITNYQNSRTLISTEYNQVKKLTDFVYQLRCNFSR